MTSMEFTGERMVPESAGDTTFWEHVYRYRFATRFVRNRRVLDIACGEGYGSAALLKAGARSVIGVDISEETCRHAHKKYGVNALPGDALDIPLSDGSVDVIVSFETIEHVEKPETFLDECTRVLIPGGQLILSTPNRDVYSEQGKHNPFHYDELNEAEFLDLLTRRFGKVQLYTQLPKVVAGRSIRSLAASDSSWVNTRGFWRTRELLRRTTCPHVWTEVNDSFRMSPVQTILGKDKYLSSLVNPYTIRKWSSWHQEHATYLIAVVTR